MVTSSAERAARSMSKSQGWLRGSNQRSQIAELAHSVRPTRVGSPRPSWMCPKTASGGCVRSIAASSACEPTWSPIAVQIAVAERRRVRDQHVDAVGDGREVLGQLVLPARHEDAAAAARRPVRHPRARRQRRRGRLRLVGLRPRAPPRAPGRAVHAQSADRRLAVAQERPRQALEHAPVPPPGEVAIARDADDRRAGLGGDALQPGREERPPATAPGWAPPSRRTG